MTTNLTPNFIAGLTRASSAPYFDTHTRGLALRVGARRKTWFFIYRRKGSNPQWLRLGEYPMLSLADARAAARAQRVLLDQKKDPVVENQIAERAAAAAIVEQKAATAPAFTFADFIPVYVAFQKGRQIKYWRDEAAMAERYLRGPWGNLPLKAIGRTHVHEVLDRAASTRLTGAGVNRLQALISRMFTVALDRHLIEAHPATRMIKRVKEVACERVLTDDELRALWAGLEARPGPAADALRLRVLLGQRGAEITGMRWSEINLEAKTWAMPSTRTKNKRPHVVALPALALAIVTRRRGEVPDDEPRVFPMLSIGSQGYRDLSVLAVGYEWKDLRRTVATRLADLGFDETVIGRVLNHARYGVTGKHYNQHTYLDEIRNALTAWDRELSRILANKPKPKARVVPMRRR